MRIDSFLVQENYFLTRSKAQMAIEEGVVLVNGKVIKKSSFDVSTSDEIKILREVLPYVSRGGLKLKKAIEEFNLDFKDKIVLDIGSSTGGFTDCSLQHGAKLVYAVDVGSSQLASSLLNDKRVVSLENTNILNLPKLEFNPDFIVMDVSFVSVSNLVVALRHYMNHAKHMVLLIKPQFELGKIHLKNGVVKDKKKHLEAINKVNTSLNSNGLFITKITVSPILGGSGNKEFLALVENNPKGFIDFTKIV